MPARNRGRNILSLLLAVIPVALEGQQAEDSAPAGVRRSEPLVTRRDLMAAGGMLAASALASLLDREVHRVFQDDGVQDARHLKRGVDVFNNLQETWLTVGGLAVYGVGRVSGQRTVADVGLHVAEAVFVASMASQTMRGPLGRARPNRSDGENPYQFHPFKGFGEFEYRSFPSVHSSSGFAAATVIAREARERWPRQKRWIAPVAYTIAATPGLSRMYLGKHWFSDVVMGAAVGVIAGQRVVTYNHRNPDNLVNRFFLGRSEDGASVRVGLQRMF